MIFLNWSKLALKFHLSSFHLLFYAPAKLRQLKFPHNLVFLFASEYMHMVFPYPEYSLLFFFHISNSISFCMTLFILLSPRSPPGWFDLFYSSDIIIPCYTYISTGKCEESLREQCYRQSIYKRQYSTLELAASKSITNIRQMKEREGEVITTQREYLMEAVYLVKAAALRRKGKEGAQEIYTSTSQPPNYCLAKYNQKLNNKQRKIESVYVIHKGLPPRSQNGVEKSRAQIEL